MCVCVRECVRARVCALEVGCLIVRTSGEPPVCARVCAGARHPASDGPVQAAPGAHVPPQSRAHVPLLRQQLGPHHHPAAQQPAAGHHGAERAGGQHQPLPALLGG